jgi:hypothetical protein
MARYSKSVILGVCLMKFALKHQGQTVESLAKSGPPGEAEARVINLAVIAAGDGKAFTRLAPRFVRKNMVERNGVFTGSPEEFPSFVASHSELLADRFLKNFNGTRRDAAHTAVLYLQKVAVSHYLVRRTKPITTDAPNLMGYLANSKRLSARTVLAVKLAYFPATLTFKDREALRKNYGVGGSMQQKLPIKTIAAKLGYPNAATLSRKLYRARNWSRRMSPAKGAGGGR